MKKLIRPTVIAMGAAMLFVSSSWAHSTMKAVISPSIDVKFGSAEDAKASGGKQMGEKSGTGDEDCCTPVPVSVGGIGGNARAEISAHGQSEGAKPAEKGFHSRSVPNVTVHAAQPEKSTWQSVREYAGRFLDAVVNTGVGAVTGKLPSLGSGLGSALLGVAH